jgi:hypothetical protein
MREPKGLQQRLELDKDGIWATTKDLCQDRYWRGIGQRVS